MPSAGHPLATGMDTELSPPVNLDTHLKPITKSNSQSIPDLDALGCVKDFLATTTKASMTAITDELH